QRFNNIRGSVLQVSVTVFINVIKTEGIGGGRCAKNHVGCGQAEIIETVPPGEQSPRIFKPGTGVIIGRIEPFTIEIRIVGENALNGGWIPNIRIQIRKKSGEVHFPRPDSLVAKIAVSNEARW